MTDEIKTNAGRTVGNWSGNSVNDLQTELERIRKQLSEEASSERVIAKEMPHRQQLPEDSEGEGRRGLCTAHVKEAVADVKDCHAYLCGPPPMVDAGIAELQEQGLGDERIFFDKFLDASHLPGGR